MVPRRHAGRAAGVFPGGDLLRVVARALRRGRPATDQRCVASPSRGTLPSAPPNTRTHAPVSARPLATPPSRSFGLVFLCAVGEHPRGGFSPLLATMLLRLLRRHPSTGPARPEGSTATPDARRLSPPHLLTVSPPSPHHRCDPTNVSRHDLKKNQTNAKQTEPMHFFVFNLCVASFAVVPGAASAGGLYSCLIPCS